MGKDITFRRATVADADVMAKLRSHMQKELMESDDSHPPLSPDELIEHNAAYFREKIPTDDFAAFVAETGAEIVGTSGIVIYRVPPTGGNPTGVEGFVMNMYTVPGQRGRGIAYTLLDRLVQHARARGARRVWLRASEFGRPVYARYGFETNDSYMAYRIPEEAGE